MASITKCVATATSMALLYDQNKYALDDPIARFMPAFAQNGKEDVTIRSCLKHGPESIRFGSRTIVPVPSTRFDRVMAEPLLKPTGMTYRYISGSSFSGNGRSLSGKTR